MTAQESHQYDFCKPGRLPDDVDSYLSGWAQAAGAYAPERLRSLLAGGFEMNAAEFETLPFQDAVQRFPSPSTGYRIGFGEDPIVSLFVLPRKLALGIVLQMLSPGEPPPEADRALTAVEENICELFFQEMCEVFSESWPEQEPLVVTQGGVEASPDRSRLYPRGEMTAMCRIRISGSFGSDDAVWLLPQQQIEACVNRLVGPSEDNSEQNRQLMMRRVLEIPVDVVVCLGQSRLHVSDLVDLKPGDVLVLDQKIDVPLPATIANTVKFHGWGGRRGPRQAYKLLSVVDESE